MDNEKEKLKRDMEKKEWIAPTLTQLRVSETKGGFGSGTENGFFGSGPSS